MGDRRGVVAVVRVGRDGGEASRVLAIAAELVRLCDDQPWVVVVQLLVVVRVSVRSREVVRRLEYLGFFVLCGIEVVLGEHV